MNLLKVAPVIGIAVASITLVTGFCPGTTSNGPSVPSDDALLPVQLSMGRPGFNKVPPPLKRTVAPARPAPGLTPDERQKVAGAINRMSPKERKRLAKAMKRMTPEQRQQMVGALKQQLAKKGPAPQLSPRAR
jgi:hypothetical protein